MRRAATLALAAVAIGVAGCGGSSPGARTAAATTCTSPKQVRALAALPRDRTVIVATHDARLLALADRVLALGLGREREREGLSNSLLLGKAVA